MKISISVHTMLKARRALTDMLTADNERTDLRELRTIMRDNMPIEHNADGIVELTEAQVHLLSAVTGIDAWVKVE